jgi:N-acetylated-alpha-linked acidic dipeptidase
MKINKFLSLFSRFIVLSLGLGILALYILPLPPSDDFPWTPSQEFQALEKKFKAAISPDHLRSFLKALTAEPHPPGSPGDRSVEEYIYTQMKSFGLGPQWNEYEVLLSSQVSSHLELTYPTREELNIYEEIIPEDPFSKRTKEFPAWSVYGASGEAEGEVVYANFGTASDFKRLKKLGVDLKGKIVLMRNYKGGRGGKIVQAQEAGAAGALFFSDPLDDGYFWGDVYPKGPWRPMAGFQRGMVNFNPLPGDQQTPGWASKKGAKRIPIDQLEGLPNIPSLPISACEARKLLEKLSGHAVPWQWNGAMGFTYRTGPGPVRVHIKTETKLEVMPIRNIVTFIEGSQFPDQWILLGNHHDAHMFGGGDPNSGTAVQLEFSRILGSWVKQGWRPQRSILINSWCAEEYGLIGSTEWVEEHADTMRDKVVVNFNMDSAIFNIDTPLFITASPTLIPLIQQTVSGLRDPRSGRPFDEVWLEQQYEYSNWFSSIGYGWQIMPGEKHYTKPKIDPFPGMDDNMPFYYHLVVPGTDMFYGTDYGMYHSVYENYHWIAEHMDPSFEYHKLMTMILGLVALRVADDDYIPFDYVNYARFVEKTLKQLEQELPDDFRTEFIGLRELCQEWKNTAGRVQRRLMQIPSLDTSARGEINAIWYRMERAFFHPDGLPGNPWFKNLFAGPGVRSQPEGKVLPGLQIALKAKDLKLWTKQTEIYKNLLKRLIDNSRLVLKKLQ